MTSDVLLFGAFPYVALALLLTISILRYRTRAYTISSLSSQFLESGKLFWGSVPFHLGIVTVALGHLTGFLIPGQIQVFNSHPLRLLVLEVSALAAALLFVFGMVLLIQRRLTTPRLRVVTTWMDWFVYLMLTWQAVTGIYIALYLRWGSAWYVQVAVPYLWSIFTLQPQVDLMTNVPLMARLHVLGAFTLFSFFSFSRLMHILVSPVPYLWRATQLVIWNRDRRAVRRA